jgi:hypothetical protein
MIINCTPHSIKIVTGSEYDPKVRKHLVTSHTVTVCELPASGQLLNARIERTPAESVLCTEMTVGGIPTVATAYPAVDPLPEGGAWVIVSAMYVAARKALSLSTETCLTVGEAVYSSATDPKPVGVLNLNRN